MEHYIGQIIKYEDFNQSTLKDYSLKGKLVKVIESPNIKPDFYHTTCELTCILYGTCICDKVKCINWQRKDNKNIIYIECNDE